MIHFCACLCAFVLQKKCSSVWVFALTLKSVCLFIAYGLVLAFYFLLLFFMWFCTSFATSRSIQIIQWHDSLGVKSHKKKMMCDLANQQTSCREVGRCLRKGDLLAQLFFQMSQVEQYL